MRTSTAASLLCVAVLGCLIVPGPVVGQAPGSSGTLVCVAYEEPLVDLEVSVAAGITHEGARVDAIPVAPGETILFFLTNADGVDHDFRIGTASQLAAPDVDTLPGIPSWGDGIQEFVWTVPDTIEGLEYGCTQPGHSVLEHGRFTTSLRPKVRHRPARAGGSRSARAASR